MRYLIGVDEAGYAPNLGPLVIAATVWRVDSWQPDDDLYKRLRRVVAKSPVKSGRPRRVAIGDSKAIYSTQVGLGPLERSVLAALSVAGIEAGDWHALWGALNRDHAGDFDQQPWHADYEARLPVAADADEVTTVAPIFARGLAEAGVKLVTLRATAVFPAYYNRCNEEFGNKSETLSKLTLRLVGDLLDGCDTGDPVDVICDRHGGRARYGRLLQEQFPDPLIEVRGETPMESVYAWGPEERRVSARFCVGGESHLPVALASMTAKYLRELAMRAFNDFWLRRVPDLRPTAGYPIDARRFKTAIGAAQAELGIEDQMIWRPR